MKEDISQNPADSVAEHPPLAEKITKLLDLLHAPVEKQGDPAAQQAAYDARFEQALQESGISISDDLTASDVYLAVEHAAYNPSPEHDGYQLPKYFSVSAIQRFGHLLKDKEFGEAMAQAARYGVPLPKNPFRGRQESKEESTKIGGFIAALRNERPSYDKNEMRNMIMRLASSAGLSFDDPALLLETWQRLALIPNTGPDGIGREFSTALWEMLPAEVTSDREVLRVLHDHMGGAGNFRANNPLRKRQVP
jgi:hypothetical protein